MDYVFVGLHPLNTSMALPAWMEHQNVCLLCLSCRGLGQVAGFFEVFEFWVMEQAANPIVGNPSLAPMPWCHELPPTEPRNRTRKTSPEALRFGPPEPGEDWRFQEPHQLIQPRSIKTALLVS